MNTCLPEIPKPRKRIRKGISFEIAQPTGKYEKVVAVGSTSSETTILPNALAVEDNEIGSHGNAMETSLCKGTEDRAKEGTNLNVKDEVSPITVAAKTKNDQKAVGFLQGSRISKQCLLTDVGTAEDTDSKLKHMLREKDREISRLQEIIRKLSVDHAGAVNRNANSSMRVAELKTKLLSEHRKVELVTTVERLRSKQRVCSETERLRHERDEAREQLARHEKLAWQLGKRVNQLGHLSEQRYKTIQEQAKKLTMKDKNLQEMRRRMEQAQIIQVVSSGGVSTERRSSSNDVTVRSSMWEGRLPKAKVNE